MEQSKETALAYEIAEKLNDMKSIDWHIGNAKRYSERLLREILEDTLSRDYLDNPAAYYNKMIQRHGKRTRN